MQRRLSLSFNAWHDATLITTSLKLMGAVIGRHLTQGRTALIFDTWKVRILPCNNLNRLHCVGCLGACLKSYQAC